MPLTWGTALILGWSGIKQRGATTLWGPVGNYGIRLDKTQNAYLAAHTVHGIDVLMIVKYAKDGDECGVIKDAVVSKDGRNHFEFVCVDCNVHPPWLLELGLRRKKRPRPPLLKRGKSVSKS